MAQAVTSFFPRARNGQTFEAAAASYIRHGGSNRFLDRVMPHLGSIPVDEIVPFDIKSLAQTLLPDQGGATRNRQVITPIRAVLLHAYERGWCAPIRLRRFKEDPPAKKSPASPIWLHLFVRQCDQDGGLDHLAALVMFMSHTGARVTESINLRVGDVDLAGRRAMLVRTKTDRHSERALTDALARRMAPLLLGRDGDERVFRYVSRFGVNDRIEAVCRRAGIEYKSSHACGRHSFATNAIAMGADVKSTMVAGGWKTTSIFLNTYVHRKDAGRLVADRFNSFQYSTEV
ncbi:tyrosine-type recombinase/integrase [Devosia soli]|uniref:tyrosine-type recombinase/integrase n=1 Tax=Devosia soli TaxID=361041 RepID=UPI000699C94B|nr:tyrosine-type recombinase/integrase [Devosia soli]